MRVAFLSDVHANLPALEAALQVAERCGAGRVVVAGDLVGDGPFPVEVVELVRARGLECIAGNVDRRVAELALEGRKLGKEIRATKKQKSNRAWSALRLRGAPTALEWLDALPGALTLPIDGHEALVVHGSPLGETDYVYPSLSPAGLAAKLAPLDGPRPDALVCGHSHLPFARRVDGVLVVNCGSVGRPADGDPRGTLALVDFEPGAAPAATLVRFTYPIARLLAAFADRDVPGIDPDELARGVKS